MIHIKNKPGLRMNSTIIKCTGRNLHLWLHMGDFNVVYLYVAVVSALRLALL